MNRWEKLAAMPPAEEAMLHFESADDPLDDADLICDGCKEDWPCSFQRGRRSVVVAQIDTLRGNLSLFEQQVSHLRGHLPNRERDQ